jgi:hypothetical protein
MKKIIFLAFVAMLARVSFAAEHEGTHEADPAPHAVVSEDASWVRPLVILIGGLFLIAIPIGIFVRANMPEEMPQVHAHDEHHGHKDPEHDLGLGGHDAHGHH